MKLPKLFLGLILGLTTFVYADPNRVRDIYIQWAGTPCADTVQWHWGMGELDDETPVNNPEDDCLRFFHRKHTFKSAVRRQVWVVFLNKDKEIGQSTPEWVDPLKGEF